MWRVRTERVSGVCTFYRINKTSLRYRVVRNDPDFELPGRPNKVDYFDLKKFREQVSWQKKVEDAELLQATRKSYAKPPPEGWSVQTFLEKINIGDNAVDIAEKFESWEDLLACTFEVYSSVSPATLAKLLHKLLIYIPPLRTRVLFWDTHLCLDRARRDNTSNC